MIDDLRRVARTEHAVAIYIGNGHAGWEAVLANILAPGDLALVIATGRFGLGWAEMARRMGIEVEVLDFGFRAPADPDRLEARLRADREGRIKAVLTVQTDTASSVRNDIPALRAAIDAAGHGALLRGRLHRLPRLRRLRDGRLGRRRDGRRLPEGADDPAGPRLHLARAEGRGRPGRSALVLLGLGAAGPAGRLLRAHSRVATCRTSISSSAPAAQPV